MEEWVETMENIIKVDDLVFEYVSEENTHRAIDNFSMEIKRDYYLMALESRLYLKI